MKSNYDAELKRVLAYEGGYSNNPKDPGGPTNYGITIADVRKYVNPKATAADVRALSVTQAAIIYRAHYWNAIRGDELPSGVDMVIFDYGVNSGNGRVARVLRHICKLPAGTTIDDSVIAAVNARDPKAIIRAVSAERLAFLKSLKTWQTFGKGWGSRVAGINTYALSIAGVIAIDSVAAPSTVPDPDPVAAEDMGKGIVPKSSTATTASTTAGGSTIAGSAVTWHDWLAAHPTVIVGGVCAVIFVVGGVVYYVEKRRQSRQLTPMNVPTVLALPVAA